MAGIISVSYTHLDVYKRQLEALSAMVQISWKEPEKKTAKAQKYKLSKPTEPVPVSYTHLTANFRSFPTDA